MPLFGNKFSPKKGQPRKWPSLSNINMDRNERAAEFGLDYGPIKLNLDGNEINFDQGQWVAETGNQREVQKLRRVKQQLEEENNLLKLKVEILLDMLAQTTAESHLQENEIENLKKITARKR